MPKIKFTESNISGLKKGWYSHDGDKYPGLRLYVGATAKTFYLTKRDPHTSKVVNVKIGRFPAESPTSAFKKAEIPPAALVDTWPDTAGLSPRMAVEVV